ncbi:hypothetical protein [Nocardia heshunensis]
MVTVNPQAFYDAAKQLSDLAKDLATARTELTTGLAATGSMAGSTDSAKQWATGYDKRASSAVDTASRLVHSTNHLSYLINVAGYNHALANYKADTNPNKGNAPSEPSDPNSAATVVNWVHPPAAGGRGTGLETSIPDLLESIGIPVPDGDTDKLNTAADAWHKYANCDAVASAQLIISSAMAKINGIDSPEVGDINSQLKTLSSSAGNLEIATGNLEADCHNLKYKLGEMRKAIHDAVREVILMIDATLALEIWATFITAGVGAITGVVLAANIVKKIKDTGTFIKGLITAEKFEVDAVKVQEAKNAVEDAATELKTIDELEAKTIEEDTALADTTPAADSAAPGGVKPTPQEAQQIISNADRTGSGLKSDSWHRSASFPIDEIGSNSTVYEITGGDGVVRTLVQMPGEVNGVTGRFEWIIDGDKITHQMFVRNGTINGVPIKP